MEESAPCPPQSLAVPPGRTGPWLNLRSPAPPAALPGGGTGRDTTAGVTPWCGGGALAGHQHPHPCAAAGHCHPAPCACPGTWKQAQEQLRSTGNHLERLSLDVAFQSRFWPLLKKESSQTCHQWAHRYGSLQLASRRKVHDRLCNYSRAVVECDNSL